MVCDENSQPGLGSIITLEIYGKVPGQTNFSKLLRRCMGKFSSRHCSEIVPKTFEKFLATPSSEKNVTMDAEVFQHNQDNIPT